MPEGDDRDRTLAQVNALIDDFVNLCNAINILGELTPRIRANILNGLLTDSGIGVSPGTPQGGSGGTYVHDFGGP